MERYTIKSVAFGGFDKEDVARYIEQLSHEAEALREERDALRQRLEQAEEAEAALREQVRTLTAEMEQSEAELHRLAPMEAETARLQKQLEVLRPDAEAHAALREQVGAIECEARKRAADLEEQSAARMHGTVEQFREQYQLLIHSFETASTHMTAELRKLEVMLTQLPRSMDQTGTELNRLAALLEKNGTQEH